MVAAEVGRPQAPVPMTTGALCRRHRFAREVIAHAVWLYARLPLSLRMVEELPPERGIDVSHETVRRWGMTFGPALARERRGRAPRPGDVGHTGEVRVAIRGRVRRLWRVVDRHGAVSGETLQRRRDRRAARRLLTRLLKRQGWRPRRIVTDRLPSHGAAKREAAPTLEHRARKASTTEPRTATSPPETRAPGAGLALAGRAAALRLGLLRGAQPPRPARPTPLRPRHPPPPPRGARRPAAGRGPRRLRSPAISRELWPNLGDGDLRRRRIVAGVQACQDLQRERYAVTETTSILPFRQGGEADDPLTALAREGARRILAEALAAEADAFVAAFAEARLEDGRQRVVRHGHGPERTIQTGIAPVPVRRPKVRDRDPVAGKPARFASAILPRWARRTRSLDALLPVLYLRGVSTGDFGRRWRRCWAATPRTCRLR